MSSLTPGRDNGDGNGSDKPNRRNNRVPLPKGSYVIYKKRKIVTGFDLYPMDMIDYSDLHNQAQEEQQPEQTPAETTAPNVDLENRTRSDLLCMWHDLADMIQVRNDVLSCIRVILCFINSHETIMEDVPVDRIRECLSSLRNYVERKNEEDDVQQKRITDYFRRY